MPIESRLLAFAVLLAAMMAITLGTIDPRLLTLSAVTVGVAVVGLLPRATPMLHGVVAVFASAMLAGLAAASGTVGLVAIGLAPLCVASLRVDWRLCIWSTVLTLVGLLVFVPHALAAPVLVPGRGPVVALVMGVWTAAFFLIGRLAADVPADESDPPSRGMGGDGLPPLESLYRQRARLPHLGLGLEPRRHGRTL